MQYLFKYSFLMPSKIKYFKSEIKEIGVTIQTLGGYLGSQNLTATGGEGYLGSLKETSGLNFTSI